jgi:DHA1 family tetracycline resistance protein-like MFS transporter
MSEAAGEAGDAAPKPLSLPTLVFLLAAVLLNTLSLGIVAPVLPFLVKSLAGGDMARAARAIGLFGAAWALMQLLCAPVLGALSDRYGRRPVILIAMFQLSADYLVMALAPSLAWLFLGRVLSGMAAAGRAAMFAYIADVTSPKDRTRLFGLVLAVGGVGTVLGPGVGGLLSVLGPRAPFWAAAAVGIANGAYGLAVLKESLPTSRRAPLDWARANPLGASGILFQNRDLLRVSGLVFLANLGMSAFTSLYVLYVNYRHHWGPAQAAGVLMAFAFASIVAQAVLAGPAAARFGERRAMIGAFALGAVGLALIGFGGSVPLLWIGVLLVAPVNLAMAALQSIRSQLVGPADQGRLQGAMLSVAGLAGMAGPIIFTWTFAWSIGPGAGIGLPGLAMFIGAGVFLAAIALALASGRVKPQASATA